MSHDIRTPMNAIMGMTSIALLHLDDTRRVIDCLNKIQTSSQHLLALINEVLDMSKIESGKIVLSEEPFHMSDILESILSITYPQTEAKKQHFNIDHPCLAHEDVVGDPLRLRQMLVNIISNAAKFTPEGGTISFRLTEKPSQIHGSACYEFVIADNGIGMEEEFIAHIFDPFTRSRKSVSQNIEGTGLGMSIAKNITQMMNGTIHVESHLNQGTTFTVEVYLKLQQKRSSDLKPSENQHSTMAGAMLKPTNAQELDHLIHVDYSGHRILLAEDNDMNLEIGRELLTNMGIQVEAARDGQQAVDAVKNHPSHYYDLIFMDIQMPNKNGYEAAREIRTIHRQDLKDIPIVAMSADAFADDIRRALDAGMNDHVAKPVEPQKLIDALKKWLR
ncbi:MAG: response regulator [Faecalicatena sp.]|uniref:ATP-binding response regulator n=1 Tax=Faecalicatena sp. TaxID=2005360 RepID=UPI00258549FC|nr:ATP-binding protein [Faecalicatena sp.]MCI6465618.1 response regulator [Faecalicatena sp.]MDY5618109.1 response regulator [Lachnospiraceae bacterium]